MNINEIKKISISGIKVFEDGSFLSKYPFKSIDALTTEYPEAPSPEDQIKANYPFWIPMDHVWLVRWVTLSFHKDADFLRSPDINSNARKEKAWDIMVSMYGSVPEMEELKPFIVKMEMWRVASLVISICTIVAGEEYSKLIAAEEAYTNLLLHVSRGVSFAVPEEKSDQALKGKWSWYESARKFEEEIVRLRSKVFPGILTDEIKALQASGEKVAIRAGLAEKRARKNSSNNDDE